MRHKWTGKVITEGDWKERNRKFGKLNIAIGIIPILGAVLTAMFFGFNWLLVIIFAPIALALLALGALLLIKRTYFVGLHLIVPKDDLKELLDEGALQTQIESLLTEHGIEYTPMSRSFYSACYVLPEKLRLGIGKMKFEKDEYLLMIQLQDIGSENALKAKEIQRIIDQLDIQDKYEGEGEV